MSSKKTKNVKGQQKTLKDIPRKTTDARSQAAYQIFEEVKKGIAIIHKTTRAGATTSTVSESINRNEKVTILVPTVKIASETIAADAVKFCEVDNAHINRIPSNHECIINQELFDKYPDLRELPIIPLAEHCEDCNNFKICPVTEVFRKPNANGTVLTYHKVAALLLAQKTRHNSTAEKIIEELRKTENLILDEIHEIQFGGQDTLLVYNGASGEVWNLNRFANLPDPAFKWIREVIKRMQTLKDNPDIKVRIQDVKSGAEERNYFEKHLTYRFVSPIYQSGKEKQTEAVKIGVIKEIIELMKVRKEYSLSIDDVLSVYKMMSLTTSPIISVNAIRDKGIIKVNLSCVDSLIKYMISSFVKSMQGRTKRILLTSATICSYDYSGLFMGQPEIKNVFFGENGDPLNTNDSFLILADNKKYGAIGKNARGKKRGEILTRIIQILELCKGNEVMIVTLNKRESILLEIDLKEAGHEQKVHYYKSPEMMGVTAKARIMIAVGLAYKPSNIYDSVTMDAEKSKKMLYESIHSDTWQAFSRVKDPEGKEPAVVFGLGCCIDDMKACIEWGFRRRITEIVDNKVGSRNKVSVKIDGNGISKPALIHCKKFEEMLTYAGNHLKVDVNCLKNEAFLTEKSLLYYTGTFESKTTVFLDSPLSLLKLMCNRRDTYGVQDNTGAYSRCKFPLTDRDLQSHISGEKTIGAYQLNKEHKVSWIAFDVDSHAPKVKDPETGKRVPKAETAEEIEKRDRTAEENKDRLSKALTSLKIPYVLEASGSAHSYHFLIFLSKPIPASLAVFAGEEIKKIAGIIGDIELFPKQTKLTQKEFGNLLKMPFATHRKTGLKSKILIDGEFQEDFSSLEIKTIDLSPLAELQQEQKEEVKEKVKTAKKAFKAAHPDFKPMGDGFLRPCFITAQMLQMNHGDGNQFRIAAAGEMFRAGYPLDVAVQYFKYQEDFDEEETRYRLSLVYEGNYHRTEQEKLKRLCTRFINCDNCGYDGICDFIGRDSISSSSVLSLASEAHVT